MVLKEKKKILFESFAFSHWFRKFDVQEQGPEEPRAASLMCICISIFGGGYVVYQVHSTHPCERLLSKRPSNVAAAVEKVTASRMACPFPEKIGTQVIA